MDDKTSKTGDGEAVSVEQPPLSADVLPGDATEAASVVGASAPARQETTRHGWLVLGTLSALMGFGSVSTDLYLPAMPEMARSLRAAPGTIELTVSGYLIGFALGQLMWGPVSDRYGRRVPILIGLVLFVIGAAGCAMSHNVWTMIGWRLVQAVGAAAGVVLGRAMVRDLYEGSRAAQMMSTLMTVMAIAPLIGPLAGGQILVFAGWPWIFWFLVFWGIATLVAVLLLPETLPPARRNGAPLGRAFQDYAVLLRNRRLLGYAGAGGFYYVGVFAYVAGTPFAYITYYHVPERLYGVVFAFGILGIMASNIVSAKLVMRYDSDRLLRAGATAAALAGLALAVTGWTGWGGLWGLIVPFFFFIGSAGFIVANSIAGALADFPDRAGAVSALVGAMQYGSGIFGATLIGVFADGTPWPMAWVTLVAGVGCMLCTRLIPARVID